MKTRCTVSKKCFLPSGVFLHKALKLQRHTLYSYKFLSLSFSCFLENKMQKTEGNDSQKSVRSSLNVCLCKITVDSWSQA